MKHHSQRRKAVFSAQQVADMIGVGLWRVKNFILVKSYGLAPSGGKGKYGRFAFEDIFRFALANQLVEFGFEPSVVGAALKAVPGKLWRCWASDAVRGKAPGPPYVALIRLNGKWHTGNPFEVPYTLMLTVGVLGAGGQFQLSLTGFCHGLYRERIEPYMFGDSRPKRPDSEVRNPRELLAGSEADGNINLKPAEGESSNVNPQAR